MAAPKGLKKPNEISGALAVVIGAKKNKASRIDCIRGLWKYIKKHELNDGRKITPDAKLAEVFGSKKPIDIMKLAGMISKNIVKDE